MFDNYRNYITRRNILGGIGIVVLISLAIFIITHGFLTITGIREGTSARHTSFTGDLQVASSATTTQNVNILPSSGYSVLTPLRAGGIDAQYTSVPFFMGTANVTVKDRPIDIRVIARSTPARVARDAKGALTGWDQDGVLQALSSKTVDNSRKNGTSNVFFPAFERAIQIDATTIGGITATDGEYVPTFYDFKTNDNKVYAAITSESAIFGRDEAVGFSIYSEDQMALRSYNPKQNTPTTVKITKPAATIDGVPLTSMNSTKAAIISGGDLYSINEDEEAEIEPVDLELSIVDSKSGETTTTKQLNQTQIRDVRLSADANYVYIQTDQSFFILDTEKLNVQYASHVTINQFKWGTDDSFVFTTLDQGIFAGSTKQKHAATLVPYNTVQPTDISFIQDGSVTFTGYSSSNEGAPNPDVYTARLSTGNRTDDVELLSKFPYQGNEFYVDYIDGRVVVELTKYLSSSGESVSEDARARAESYITDIFDEAVPTVVYTYIVSDLRAPTLTD